MFSIKNCNDFDFEAGYDGKRYSFPKGKSVAVNTDAAIHIFAIGRDYKDDVFLRHGWFGAGRQDRERAEKILQNFKLSSIDTVKDGAVIEKERSTASARVEGGVVSGGSASQEAPTGGPKLPG